MRKLLLRDSQLAEILARWQGQILFLVLSVIGTVFGSN